MPFDPSKEINLLLELGLTEEDTVVGFGTGTGVFPFAGADHCDRVVAIDIFEILLEVVHRKLEMSGAFRT